MDAANGTAATLLLNFK